MQGIGAVCQQQHVGGDFQAVRPKIGGPAALQSRDSLFHFQGVAHGVPQRLVHVGEEGGGLLAGILPNPHHHLRQFSRLRQGGHKRAAAQLHIQHNGIRAACQLLRHNGRGDQRDAGDRPRHVAQGVEFAVGGRQPRRLPCQRQTDLCQLPFELGQRQVWRPALNGFHFVQRAAAGTQTAPAHLAHRQTAGSHQRLHHQRRLIAHAAGGVFVYGEGGHVVQIEQVARVSHSQGQGHRFPPAHAANGDRHDQRRRLVIRNAASGVFLNKPANLLIAEFAPVSFCFNQVNDVHVHPLPQFTDMLPVKLLSGNYNIYRQGEQKMGSKKPAFLRGRAFLQ